MFLSSDLSNSSIMACNSSSLSVSPSSRETRRRFFSEMVPVWSSSNSEKALRISSSGSRSAIYKQTTNSNDERRVLTMYAQL